MCRNVEPQLIELKNWGGADSRGGGPIADSGGGGLEKLANLREPREIASASRAMHVWEAWLPHVHAWLDYSTRSNTPVGFFGGAHVLIQVVGGG